MRKYEYFQWNWILIIGLGAVVLLLSIKFSDPDTLPVPVVVTLLIQLLLMIIPLLFYGLRTTIDDDKIVLKFGIGIINIKLNLADIQSVEIVRNPWYYGIGIRLIPGGMLYNAHGFDAVELRFKNKKQKVRIGTGEPEILKYEIEKQIKV